MNKEVKFRKAVGKRSINLKNTKEITQNKKELLPYIRITALGLSIGFDSVIID